MASKPRKAVSPIVATLLLILIAVSASVIIYTWVTGLTSSNKTGTTEVQGRIAVESAELTDASSNNVKVYVRNIGDVDVEVKGASIYVYDLNGTLVGSDTGASSNKNNIGPGELATITGTVQDIQPGHYYRVEVALPNGLKDSIVVRASSA